MNNYCSTVKYYVCMTLGTLIASVGINSMASHSLAFGGVSGLAIVLEYLTKVPLPILNIVLNFPLFLLGAHFIGKQFLVRSIFSTLMLSVFLNATGFVKNYNIDLIISAIFGGILLGIGVGIIAKSGGSTGGTDLLALVLHKHTGVALGTYILFIDGTIILLGAFIFNLNKALYSILVVFFISQSVNETMKNFESFTQRLSMPIKNFLVRT